MPLLSSTSASMTSALTIPLSAKIYILDVFASDQMLHPLILHDLLKTIRNQTATTKVKLNLPQILSPATTGITIPRAPAPSLPANTNMPVLLAVVLTVCLHAPPRKLKWRHLRGASYVSFLFFFFASTLISNFK